MRWTAWLQGTDIGKPQLAGSNPNQIASGVGSEVRVAAIPIFIPSRCHRAPCAHARATRHRKIETADREGSAWRTDFRAVTAAMFRGAGRRQAFGGRLHQCLLREKYAGDLRVTGRH
jgi:hypothetical protein